MKDDDVVTVRNTFINVVPAAPPTLRHSRSDSDISSTLSESSESETLHNAASSMQRQNGGHRLWGPIENSGSSLSDGNNRRLLESVEVCEASRSSDGLSSDDGRVESERPRMEEWERAAELGVPSRGSVWHEIGQCKPCNYIVKARGCHLGFECAFCHLEHSAVQRSRPGKVKRAKAKRIVQTMSIAFGDDPMLMEHCGLHLAEKSEYMKSVVDASRENPEQPDADASELNERRLTELHTALKGSVGGRMSL